MPPHILRLAYISEFLLALLAVLMFWSEIGGQGHLDLMPWYVKCILSLGLALAAVQATVSAVSHENAWNKRTILWLTAGVVVLCAMAAITYYYHLHENDDQDDETDEPARVALNAATSPPLGGFSA